MSGGGSREAAARSSFVDALDRPGIAGDTEPRVARRTLADLERNPKGIRIDDLLTVLRDNGFKIRSGTRHGYIASRGDQTLTVPRHSAIVKPAYVRQAIKFLRGGDER